VDLTFDDLIRRRALLSSREAAALVFAVGRERDRQRAAAGDMLLPPPGAIMLTPAGDIKFAAVRSAWDPDRGSQSLSSLLARLLGIDHDQAMRPRIPDGLLISIAGRVAPMDLASQHDDAFQSTLARFADPNPRVLRKVYWRLSGGRRRSDRPSSVVPAAGADRRAQPHIVTALRREIRHFEREKFEASRSDGLNGGRQPFWDRVGARAAVAAAAALAAVAVFIVWSMQRITPPPVARATPPIIVAPPSPISPAVSVVPAAVNLPAAARGTRRAAPSKTAARRPFDTTPRPVPVSFIGGTRGIAWLSR
jgi:hypothetical protein